MSKTYISCKSCGKEEFKIFRDSEDDIGTYEECIDCGTIQ